MADCRALITYGFISLRVVQYSVKKLEFTHINKVREDVVDGSMTLGSNGDGQQLEAACRRPGPQVKEGQEPAACQRSMSVRHRDHAGGWLGVAGPGLAGHQRQGPGKVGEHRSGGTGLDGIAE